VDAVQFPLLHVGGGVRGGGAMGLDAAGNLLSPALSSHGRDFCTAAGIAVSDPSRRFATQSSSGCSYRFYNKIYNFMLRSGLLRPRLEASLTGAEAPVQKPP
jgi:hypothetical protein